MLKATLAALLWGIALSANAFAESPQSIDVPPGGLAEALKTLANQADVELMFRGDEVEGIKTQGVRGTLLPSEAVSILLKGTNLSLHVDADGALLIGKHIPESGSVDHQGSASKEATASRNFGDRVRLAQVEQSPPAAVGVAGGPSEPDQTLQEVVVTAEKQGEERLLDVPVPVSVINTNELVAQGRVELKDYVSDVPGITLTPAFLQAEALTIRGVGAAGFDNPAVGMTVDDVPFSSSTGGGGGWLLPEVDPGDLARIEVLRGPQGAVYGSGSMGGLLRYVTKDPSTEGFSGHFQAGTSSVYHGPDPGYDFRGSVNVPVSSSVAIRASAFREQIPGYIDNTNSGQRGINEANNYGGRVAVLWKMGNTTSIKLTALYQQSRHNESDEVIVGPGLGDLQSNAIPGSSLGDVGLASYSANILTRVGPFDVTSITSYSKVYGSIFVDDTVGLGSLVGSLYPALGYSGTNYGGIYDVGKFTEEMRLSGQFADRLSYSMGGFYTRETSQETAYASALNNNSGQVLVTNYYQSWYTDPIVYREVAGFGSLSYRFTDAFDVQLGGRFTHESFDNPVGITSINGNVTTAAAYSSAADVWTYLFSPEYHITKNWMVYARLASGFRPGTANPVPSTALTGFTIPQQSNPDQTRDYELGMKGSLFERRMDFDISLYHIDWINIQFQTRDPTNTYPFETNGSGAKSDGVEMSLAARPREGLSISGWFAYDNAELKQAFPAAAPAVGLAGDPLPDVPRYSGNVSINQDVMLPGSVVGFIGAQLSYIGDRKGPFVSSPIRQEFPAYTKLDLHVGARFDSWEIRGYLNNASDVRAAVGGGLGTYNIAMRQYITPRTVGVTISKSF